MAKEVKVADKSQYKLVNRVMTALNLGDSGKVESFFNRTRKSLQVKIDKLEANESTSALQFKISHNELTSNIEDATEDLSNAYINVMIERISNNAAQDSFMKEYLSNIERKEDKLASLTADLETLKESNAERKRNFKADKKAYEDRIEMISEIEVK